MPDRLGVHLLGRKPSDPDERDYPLRAFLDGGDTYDAATAAVMRSVWTAGAVKRWVKLTAQLVKANVPPPPPPPLPPPSPNPAPTPTPGPVVVTPDWWTTDDVILDQGDTPHCVGFTGADWEQALPVYDQVTDADGDDIYAACKVKDGEPGEQNGSTIRSLGQVLQDRGKLKTYAFADTINDVIDFVTQFGPICWGIGWTESMFTPGASGLIVPSGADIGGHAILETHYDPVSDRHWGPNHWGDWGYHGFWSMTTRDLAGRLADGGEAMAAVEIAA